MKTAYLEIGHYCYANCISCNTSQFNYEKPQYGLLVRRIQRLHDAGFECVRLTGLEPISHPNFGNIVDFCHVLGLKVHILTTLLSPDNSIVGFVNECDEVKISLHAVGPRYKIFHSVDKFDRLCENLWKLDDYTIYYTLVSVNNVSNFDAKSAMDLANFLSLSKKPVEIFQMHKEWTHLENTAIDGFIYSLKSNYSNVKYTKNVSKKQTFCTANKHNLYVTFSGDTYPCCMAGGEVGNVTSNQVRLGNIDEVSVESMMKKRLTNLNNSVCDKCTPKYYTTMEGINE